MNVHPIPVVEVVSYYYPQEIDTPPKTVYLDFDRLVSVEQKNGLTVLNTDVCGLTYVTTLHIGDILTVWKSGRSKI